MGSIFMIVFLSCFGVPYADYKSSAQPVSWLLMPATVSLAIPLYEKWELLEKNLAAIFASIAAGVLTSLGSVLAMAWVLKLERAHAVSFCRNPLRRPSAWMWPRHWAARRRWPVRSSS